MYVLFAFAKAPVRMRGRHTPRDRHPSLSVCARVAGTTRRQSAGARRRVAHSHRARLLIVFV